MQPRTDTYKAMSCDCGADGALRLPRFLDFLQETASEHARELGFDFPVVDEATGERGAWVLSQLRLRMVRVPRWREEIRVTTVPWGVRALTANRDFSVAFADGSPCAVATTRWAMISPRTRRAVRIPAFVASFDFPHEPLFGPDDPFSRLRPPVSDPPDAVSTRHRAERAHIDLNGHVNNTVYAGWMLESVPAETVAGARLAEIEIAFRSETLLGDEVLSVSAPSGPGTFFHRVRAPGGADHLLGVTRWA